MLKDGPFLQQPMLLSGLDDDTFLEEFRKFLRKTWSAKARIGLEGFWKLDKK